MNGVKSYPQTQTPRLRSNAFSQLLSLTHLPFQSFIYLITHTHTERAQIRGASSARQNWKKVIRQTFLGRSKIKAERSAAYATPPSGFSRLFHAVFSSLEVLSQALRSCSGLKHRSLQRVGWPSLWSCRSFWPLLQHDLL